MSESKKRNPRVRNPSQLLPKELYENLYYDQQLSMRSIGIMVGLSVGTVYNLGKKYGIESRNVGSQIGREMTEETRQKISKANKGRKTSEAQKQKLSKLKFRGGVGYKKKRNDGYIAIHFPEHPRATKEGMIMEHDLVAECARGYALKPDEVVHHKNGIKDDNRLCNLQIMTFKEHAALHMRQRWDKKRGIT